MDAIKAIVDNVARQQKLVYVANDSCRTACAALLAMWCARVLGMPESYWAVITAFVVTQSSLGAALPPSVQRFLGTGLGAIVGAVVTSYLGSTILIFAGVVVALGIVCHFSRLDQSGYRFACITLGIVTLVPHTFSVWIIGWHRFVEVSAGIVSGLIISAAWPARPQWMCAGSCQTASQSRILK